MNIRRTVLISVSLTVDIPAIIVVTFVHIVYAFRVGYDEAMLSYAERLHMMIGERKRLWRRLI